MKDVTLLFLRREGQILLAMKKRGFGAGRWNGVGGKVEPGETIRAAAIRECREEIGITPHRPQLVGELIFYEANDSSFGHHARVFLATEWQGEPSETEEMRPRWFDLKDIPYDQMWADDRYWLPLLLSGKYFHGSFTLDDNAVADYQLQEVTSQRTGAS